MNKAILNKNVALLQINVKQGVDEYYLAKNTDWQKRVIDRIVALSPVSPGMVSPIDGVTPVFTQADMDSLYLDLYGKDEHTICNGMSIQAIAHTNNHPFEIHQELQFNMSRLFFTSSPAQDGCILLYVFYDSKEACDYELPQKSITIQFPLAADEEISFTRLVNTYIHASNKSVKGVDFWDADNNPAYVTLRDHQNTYVIHDLCTLLCRPQMAGTTAEESQVMPMLFDSIDIDFDNSYIRNATGSSCTQTMTIKY